MGAFDNFLKRNGYAKLDRYGLVLTPDDRVLSTRSAVLDDGLGGKIVGWVDGDLAAMELDRWGAAKAAPAKPVAAPRSAQVKPAPPARPSGVTGLAPIAPPPVAAPAPVAVAAPAAVAPPIVTRPAASAPVVAEEPIVDEDDWEWTIAMARARAVADDVETAAASMAFTKPKAPVQKTLQMAAAAPPARRDPLPAWPQTEELPQSWNEKTEASAPRVMSPVEKAIAVEKRSTVIPVPQLPVAARPTDVRPAPHVRMSTPPRTRMARGTGREDTVQIKPIAGANDDQTSPYVMLPPEVNTSSGHAHTRRAAAKHR